MTGPEHYRRAEELLVEADTILRPNDEGPCEADRVIAAAQVHATLALVAATALPTGRRGTASRDTWVMAVHGSSEKDTTPEPDLPECVYCGNHKGPWRPTGDRYASGAQVLECVTNCAAPAGGTA
ncbi:hypothetical protein AB0H29_08215 [Streptomyces thermolilacinus]